MQYLTVKEIAFKFGVDKRAAQNWVKDGRFPNARMEIVPPFGGVWRIPESDLENFVRPKAGNPRNLRKEKKAA